MRVVVVGPITLDTTRFGAALTCCARRARSWSMHSDQSSSITSVSASLSALRNVTSTGAGCFFLFRLDHRDALLAIGLVVRDGRRRAHHHCCRFG
jgi:hypothetical protein